MASSSTIAYVRPNDQTGHEIRLIAPDGGNDRSIWSTGMADPGGVYSIGSLTWQPGGAELAFAGTHESGCSINSGNIFVVGADGQGYRRVTEAPACAALGGYPQGTVEIPVRSASDFTGFIYFQGAPAAQMVTLPAGGSATVTFQSVADFGAGELQIAALIVGCWSSMAARLRGVCRAGGKSHNFTCPCCSARAEQNRCRELDDPAHPQWQRPAP